MCVCERSGTVSGVRLFNDSISYFDFSHDQTLRNALICSPGIDERVTAHAEPCIMTTSQLLRLFEFRCARLVRLARQQISVASRRIDEES